MSNPTPQSIAEKLSEAEQAALVPFTTFSDSVGAELKRLGLLTQRDGCWFHTDLGLQVRTILSRKEQNDAR